MRRREREPVISSSQELFQSVSNLLRNIGVEQEVVEKDGVNVIFGFAQTRIRTFLVTPPVTTEFRGGEINLVVQGELQGNQIKEISIIKNPDDERTRELLFSMIKGEEPQSEELDLALVLFPTIQSSLLLPLGHS